MVRVVLEAVAVPVAPHRGPATAQSRYSGDPVAVEREDGSCPVMTTVSLPVGFKTGLRSAPWKNDDIECLRGAGEKSRAIDEESGVVYDLNLNSYGKIVVVIVIVRS